MAKMEGVNFKYQWNFTIIDTSAKTNSRLTNVSNGPQNSYRRQVNSQQYKTDKYNWTKIQIKY